MSSIPISVVIASHNEGDLLIDCLKSVEFCDEIIVYDLESTDNTATIAVEHGATVIRHSLVPAVEEIRVKAVGLCKHPLIIFTDPDERITPGLAKEMIEFARAPLANCAFMAAPCIYYFKRKRLKGTMWGVGRFRPILFNRDGVIFNPNVHTGIKVKPGYSECSFGDPEQAYITHFWADSLTVLFSKHRRYLKGEGASKYSSGERYPGAFRHFRSAVAAFYSSYIFFRGYKDGLNGFFLSLLWSWYTFGSLSALHRYEKSLKTNSMRE